MKRKLFLMISFVFAVYASYAQDIITKVSGEEIPAVITEVGATDIKYKRFENQDGPAYTMQKSEIFMIRYQNGEREMFGVQAQSQQQAQTAQKTQQQSGQQNQSSGGLPEFLKKKPIENEHGRWILSAGMNTSYLLAETKNNSDESDSRTSYIFGLTYEFPLSKTLPIYGETGLMVADKGYREFYEDDYEDETEEFKLSLLYLNVPFVVSYRLQLSPDFSLQPFLGLYLGYAISGKMSYEYNYYDDYYDKYTTVKDSETKLFKKGGYERLDMGMRYGLSASYGDALVSLGWESGFMNIQNDAPKNYSLTNKSFFFSLGYKF